MNKIKIASVVLIVMSGVTLLLGWVKFSSKSMLDEIFFDSWNDLDTIQTEYAEELKELGDELKSVGINVTPNEMLKSMTNVTHMLRDGSVSPFELATRFNKFISVSKKMSKLTDEQKQYIPVDVLGLYGEGYEEVYTIIGIYKLVFWATIIIYLIYIVLRIMEKRNLGITLIVIQLLWLFFTILMVGAINDSAGAIVELTIVPFVSLVCLIASTALWAIKRPAKIVKNK